MPQHRDRNRLRRALDGAERRAGDRRRRTGRAGPRRPPPPPARPRRRPLPRVPDRWRGDVRRHRDHRDRRSPRRRRPEGPHRPPTPGVTMDQRATEVDTWENLLPELSRVITRQQPFGPPDAAQFTSSTELMRVLYDPSNRTHQQAESSGAPYVIGRKGAGKTAFVTAPKLDAGAVPVELPSADVYQGVFDVVSDLLYRGTRMFPEHTARLWRHLAWCAVLCELVRHDQAPDAETSRVVREFCESL